MFRRAFALTFAVALAVCMAGPVRANPLPCPSSSLSETLQTVAAEIYDCYSESLSASAITRRPTQAAVSYEWLDGYELDTAPCPPSSDDAVAVPFQACSQSFDGGGEYSEGA